VIYIREAHPTDGRQVPANIRDNILIADPKSLEERRKVAHQFAEQFKISLPILVDTLDDQLEKAYAGWPDRLYVIDAAGRIAYKGAPGPGGFKVAEIPTVLDRLLADPMAGAAPAAPRPAPPALPPAARDRLLSMLQRAGLEETATEPVLRAVGEKMAAYRAVAEARDALMRDVRQQGDVTAALVAYQTAQQEYGKAVERIDRELGAAIGYTRKPRLQAALTAMGLIGQAPAPPPGSAPGPGRGAAR
jgi:hypothetical protein